MINILFLTILLNCSIPTIVNISGEAWNSIDERNYKQAIKRCPEKYPKSPCLRTFTKVRPGIYRAICGRVE